MALLLVILQGPFKRSSHNNHTTCSQNLPSNSPPITLLSALERVITKEEKAWVERENGERTTHVNVCEIYNVKVSNDRESMRSMSQRVENGNI
ncbi:hypothetical protein SESBI_42585 [Sesbania bispinosa]|nr:hypothetical protein SESBI_42585 [Sesbania bispinosa]